MIAEDDADDYTTQPTVVLQQAPEPREFIVVCPLCHMHYNSIFGLGRWDARREPIGICPEHLERLSYMSDTDYDMAMEIQWTALWRLLYPFAWGEQK